MPSKLQFTALLVIATLILAGAILLNSYRVQGVANLAALAPPSFEGTLAWVIAGGYLAMLIGMTLEGPIVTAAAAFASALGFFQLWIIFALAILGDLIADLAYYGIGYFSRVAVIEKYGHRFGLSAERMEKLERLLKTHPIKTLVVIKLTPLAVPGLLTVGAIRLQFKKFITIALLIILPKVIAFMALGYYFGRAYDRLSRSIENGQYIIFIALALIFAAYFGYKKIAILAAKRIETI